MGFLIGYWLGRSAGEGSDSGGSIGPLLAGFALFCALCSASLEVIKYLLIKSGITTKEQMLVFWNWMLSAYGYQGGAESYFGAAWFSVLWVIIAVVAVHIIIGGAYFLIKAKKGIIAIIFAFFLSPAVLYFGLLGIVHFLRSMMFFFFAFLGWLFG